MQHLNRDSYRGQDSSFSPCQEPLVTERPGHPFLSYEGYQEEIEGAPKDRKKHPNDEISFTIGKPFQSQPKVSPGDREKGKLELDGEC